MGEENSARHDVELASIIQHATAQLVSEISTLNLVTENSRKNNNTFSDINFGSSKWQDAIFF